MGPVCLRSQGRFEEPVRPCLFRCTVYILQREIVHIRKDLKVVTKLERNTGNFGKTMNVSVCGWLFVRLSCDQQNDN